MIKKEQFIDANLPYPLSKEELYQCFQKYYSGDKEAKEKIIKSNIRLVIHQALKFYNTPYEQEELISVGLIGLLKSVDAFDETRGVSFVTYASRCINNEILMFIRVNKKHNCLISFEEIICSDQEGKEEKLFDLLGDEKVDLIRDYEEKETSFMIRKLVDQLPESERRLILLYFGFDNKKPLTQKEIAKQFGISQSAVSRTICKGLKKLKVELQKELYEEDNKNYLREKKSQDYERISSLFKTTSLKETLKELNPKERKIAYLKLKNREDQDLFKEFLLQLPEVKRKKAEAAANKALLIYRKKFNDLIDYATTVIHKKEERSAKKMIKQ